MSSPSFEHEGYVRLFKDCPALVAELLRSVFGVELSAYTELRVESAELTDIQPAKRYADLLVQLIANDKPVHGVIVEVQIDPAEEKEFSWPMYLTGARAQLRCPVDVLVFTPKQSVARWAARRIQLGLRASFEPFVVGPDGMPTVTDPELAARERELAVMSAMAHGKGPVDEAVRIALVALQAVQSFADARALLYSDLIFAALSAAARAKLEELMTQGYEFQSDFAKRHRAEGRAEGEAQAILTVLEARGIAVSNAERERILASTDLDVLERWLRKALTAASTDELFAD
jgi:hypothetical protein